MSRSVSIVFAAAVAALSLYLIKAVRSWPFGQRRRRLTDAERAKLREAFTPFRRRMFAGLLLSAPVVILGSIWMLSWARSAQRSAREVVSLVWFLAICAFIATHRSWISQRACRDAPNSPALFHCCFGPELYAWEEASVMSNLPGEFMPTLHAACTTSQCL